MNIFKYLLFSVLMAVTMIASSEVIDINTADAKSFNRAMKGVGDVKSKAIVDYRSLHGPFKTVDDLKKVQGIGDKILEENRANLTVGGNVKTPAAASPATTKPMSSAPSSAPAVASPKTPSSPVPTSTKPMGGQGKPPVQ